MRFYCKVILLLLFGKVCTANASYQPANASVAGIPDEEHLAKRLITHTVRETPDFDALCKARRVPGLRLLGSVDSEDRFCDSDISFTQYCYESRYSHGSVRRMTLQENFPCGGELRCIPVNATYPYDTIWSSKIQFRGRKSVKCFGPKLTEFKLSEAHATQGIIGKLIPVYSPDWVGYKHRSAMAKVSVEGDTSDSPFAIEIGHGPKGLVRDVAQRMEFKNGLQEGTYHDMIMVYDVPQDEPKPVFEAFVEFNKSHANTLQVWSSWTTFSGPWISLPDVPQDSQGLEFEPFEPEGAGPGEQVAGQTPNPGAPTSPTAPAKTNATQPGRV